MTSLVAGTSTDGGADQSAEHQAACFIHEEEPALHDTRDPGVDAWSASDAEHRGDRASRAGCQIQQAQQHQRFMRTIYRTYRKLLAHYAQGFTNDDPQRTEDILRWTRMVVQSLCGGGGIHVPLTEWVLLAESARC